jgi:hypothetical protein
LSVCVRFSLIDEIEKVKDQLELGKPAARTVLNNQIERPGKQPLCFTAKTFNRLSESRRPSGEKSCHDWRPLKRPNPFNLVLEQNLARQRFTDYHSLNSPACSCVSITFVSIIANANHSIM